MCTCSARQAAGQPGGFTAAERCALTGPTWWTSSEQSVPSVLSIADRVLTAQPQVHPGCVCTWCVMSYTMPSTTIQPLSLLACRSTSPIVILRHRPCPASRDWRAAASALTVSVGGVAGLAMPSGSFSLLNRKQSVLSFPLFSFCWKATFLCPVPRLLPAYGSAHLHARCLNLDSVSLQLVTYSACLLNPCLSLDISKARSKMAAGKVLIVATNHTKFSDGTPTGSWCGCRLAAQCLGTRQ